MLILTPVRHNSRSAAHSEAWSTRARNCGGFIVGKDFVLAMDQGTTSSRSIVFDATGGIRASVSQEYDQLYPQPGWVEHNPEAIWESQIATARAAILQAGLSPHDIAAIGITNQRETTVVWDKTSGRPVFNAIVWQCRRTSGLCAQLKQEGLESEVRQRTGLVLDAYFSGTKLRWILDHVDGARALAEEGGLCFGTVDSWLLYKLCGIHATDYSNASRTLLFNIHHLDWDDTLLGALKIPRAMLPEVKPSSFIYGITKVFGPEIPVAALCGDQQSALFGQAAFAPGECKNTYGTGCFLLMNTGERPVASHHGLLTTIAWGLDGKVEYALEGSVFIGGAVVQWLRDEMHLIDSAAQSETVAAEVEDNGGVYVVPAFVGLGAPHWNMSARGTITGLTRGSGRAHVVRAALESISFQSADVIRCMEAELKSRIPVLKVDGGAARNNLLMQHQADVLGAPVLRGQTTETTALGAAFLAGLAAGIWKEKNELRDIWREERRFVPQWNINRREAAVSGWRAAINRTIA
ncbi:MAG: glycerol kinase GlpK [Candidatus Hydrogenedentes bacterium]|nr:glycerol kinase GlpK [Candidatus Hydrogenedentota bacterium]